MGRLPLAGFALSVLCAVARAQTADDDRNLALYRRWLPAHGAEVAAFESFPSRPTATQP